MGEMRHELLDIRGVPRSGCDALRSGPVGAAAVVVALKDKAVGIEFSGRKRAAEETVWAARLLMVIEPNGCPR